MYHQCGGWFHRDDGRGLIVKPFEPIDFYSMKEIESVASFRDKPEVDPWEIARQPHSYTIETQDGEVVACAGVMEYFSGYGSAWIMMSSLARKHMMALIGIVRRFLFLSHFRRIEATVDTRHPNGHRLVRLLGFCRDCVLKGYTRDADFVLYSIVKA